MLLYHENCISDLYPFARLKIGFSFTEIPFDRSVYITVTVSVVCLAGKKRIIYLCGPLVIPL